jgi:hypothetical protein
MNPDQYSCNMKQLFLIHTMNYTWLAFSQGDRDSYFYRSFFEIYVTNDQDYYTQWSIKIDFIGSGTFSRRSYKTGGYNGSVDFFGHGWRMEFK